MSKRRRKKIRAGKTYHDRGLVLGYLGFGSYREYLNSSLWAKIRERVLWRDHYTCRLCGDRATQAHHNRYSLNAMRGADLQAIVAICGRCHETIEFTVSGNKRMLKWAAKMCSSLDIKLMPPHLRPLPNRRPRTPKKDLSVEQPKPTVLDIKGRRIVQRGLG